MRVCTALCVGVNESVTVTKNRSHRDDRFLEEGFNLHFFTPTKVAWTTVVGRCAARADKDLAVCCSLTRCRIRLQRAV